MENWKVISYYLRTYYHQNKQFLITINNNIMNENEKHVSERLEYLKKIFRVKSNDELNELYNNGRVLNLGDPHMEKYTFIMSEVGKTVLAVKITEHKTEKRSKTTVLISESVFDDMVKADPTDNSEFVQWMLTVFRNLIKDGKNCTQEARRFAEEDLGQANTYLDLFRKNKGKKLFKELCDNSRTAPKNDCTNINQYSSLSQLFDAVDPFAERKPSDLANTISKFCDAKQALVPYRDRKFTVYVPLTRDASCIMESFASWCTAKPENGMFKSYTENNRLYDGSPSKLYIIINNDMFKGESNECYQIHFESNQIKGRENGSNINIYESVFSKSESLGEFFKDELINLLKNSTNNQKMYSDYLVKFGFTESLFEIYEDDVKTINFTKIEIPKLPDLSRFKNLDEFIIMESSLSSLHESIGELTNLEMLALPINKITTLPIEIGNLRKLEFLNLTGNKIVDFPIELSKLDPTNGGSLIRLAIDNLGEEKMNKLKQLLPTVSISLPIVR